MNFAEFHPGSTQRKNESEGRKQHRLTDSGYDRLSPKNSINSICLITLSSSFEWNRRRSRLNFCTDTDKRIDETPGELISIYFRYTPEIRVQLR